MSGYDQPALSEHGEIAGLETGEENAVFEGGII